MATLGELLERTHDPEKERVGRAMRRLALAGMIEPKPEPFRDIPTAVTVSSTGTQAASPDLSRFKAGLDAYPGHVAGQLADALMAPQRAYSGELQVVDPTTGRTSDAALEAGMGLAGLAMTGGVAGVGGRGAVIGSGPVRRTDDLPMDEASRMARAKELGYGEQRFYHGSKRDFEAFDLNAQQSERGPLLSGKGVYLTDRPDYAAKYAGETGSVYPVVARGERINAYDKPTPEMVARLEAAHGAATQRKLADLEGRASPEYLDHVRRVGSESSVLPRASSPADFDTWHAWISANQGMAEPLLGEAGLILNRPGAEQVVYNTADIRSRFAAFDPANEGSGLLLGSGSTDRKGAAAMGALLMGEKGPIRAYHGSPHDFDRFDLSRARGGNYGDAVYFHTAEADARRYRFDGGKTYEAEISSLRPFEMDKPVSAGDAIAILEAAGQKRAADLTRESGEGYRSGSELYYWGMGQGADPREKTRAIRAAGFDTIIGDPGREITGASKRSPEIAVLNPALITILRKYGVASFAALPPAVQAAFMAENPPQQ